jgi:excisionase family DNA binding protein
VDTRRKFPARGVLRSKGDERLLTTEEVAERLGIAKKTLEAWRVRGVGPPFCHVGRLVRYRPAAVSAWLVEREVQSTSASLGSTNKQRQGVS